MCVYIYIFIHMQYPATQLGSANLYIYTVYCHIPGGFPAKNTELAPYTYGSGQS
jgi:hypothetical protein